MASHLVECNSSALSQLETLLPKIPISLSTQKDPLSEGTNHNIYVGNNPVNATDPTGTSIKATVDEAERLEKYFDVKLIESAAGSGIYNDLKANSILAPGLEKTVKSKDEFSVKATIEAVQASLDKVGFPVGVDGDWGTKSKRGLVLYRADLGLDNAVGGIVAEESKEEYRQRLKAAAFPLTKHDFKKLNKEFNDWQLQRSIVIKGEIKRMAQVMFAEFVAKDNKLFKNTAFAVGWSVKNRIADTVHYPRQTTVANTIRKAIYSSVNPNSVFQVFGISIDELPCFL